MKYLWLSMIWAALTVGAPVPAGAQTGSIILNVPHARQEANQLCWAALVSALLFQNPDGSRPAQCDLVDMLNEIKSPETEPCCGRLDQPECNPTATQVEIEALLTRFGMKVEKINLPAGPEDVYGYLKSGRVLLVGVQTTPTDNHIYMVRGLSWENGQAILTVNDPYYETSTRIPFQEARPTWLLALAVG